MATHALCWHRHPGVSPHRPGLHRHWHCPLCHFKKHPSVGGTTVTASDDISFLGRDAFVSTQLYHSVFILILMCLIYCNSIALIHVIFLFPFKTEEELNHIMQDIS